MLGQDAVNSAKAFHDRLPLHGLLLTKVDGDARGGAALSIVKVTGRPILFAGVGEKPEDLEEFDPPRMAGRILGMGDVVGLVEKAQQVIDEKEAEKQAQKLQKGQFTFEDFLQQLAMIRKLGPMKKVLGMLPGVGSALQGVDFDDKHMKRLEAMILSMTVRERQRPDVIDLPRRRRIAAGSGNDLEAVNGLIKQFKNEHPKVRVLAAFGDIAASGGYYVACAADRIVARRSTITGSIGVIMSSWNMAEAAKKLGIEQIAIKSDKTPFKDILSMTRPMADAEKAMLTSIVDELYLQFVDVVDEGRPELDREQVIQLANGGIYSAGQALKNGLIDEIVDPSSIEAWFADRGPVQIVEHRRRPTLRDALFGSEAKAPQDLSAVAAQLMASSTGPRFLYFWQGAR
jgi:signal peptide peptidase SppA